MFLIKLNREQLFLTTSVRICAKAAILFNLIPDAIFALSVLLRKP